MAGEVLDGGYGIGHIKEGLRLRGEQHVEVHERERGRRDPGTSELHGEVPGGAERGAGEEDCAGASAAHGRLRGEDPSVGGHIEEGDGVERGLVVALRRLDCR